MVIKKNQVEPTQKKLMCGKIARKKLKSWAWWISFIKKIIESSSSSFARNRSSVHEFIEKLPIQVQFKKKLVVSRTERVNLTHCWWNSLPETIEKLISIFFTLSSLWCYSYWSKYDGNIFFLVFTGLLKLRGTKNRNDICSC